MAWVQLRNLTKRFGKDVVAVNDVTLDIKAGEFVCFLGPSGCGKTTTLRMVAGFLKPDAGEIIVNGETISGPRWSISPDKRRMAMVFQSYALWPHKTVFANVAYGLQLRRVPKEEIARRVRSILRVVGMEGLADRYPGELSGGQQQRVALARALVVQPSVLLLDEPLSNLDAKLREMMRFEVRRLHDEFGLTSLYVTHDQAEAMVTADRIVVMNEGRIVQVGTPREIYEEPETVFVATFIGKANVFEGKLADDGHTFVISDRERILVASDRGHRPGVPLGLAIRPHDIVIRPQGAASGEGDDAAVLPGGGANGAQAVAARTCLIGVIERSTYLGECLDYEVRTEAGTVVRVSSSPRLKLGVGDRVELLFPPDACKVVRLDTAVADGGLEVVDERASA